MRQGKSVSTGGRQLWLSRMQVAGEEVLRASAGHGRTCKWLPSSMGTLTLSAVSACTRGMLMQVMRSSPLRSNWGCRASRTTRITSEQPRPGTSSPLPLNTILHTSTILAYITVFHCVRRLPACSACTPSVIASKLFIASMCPFSQSPVGSRAAPMPAGCRFIARNDAHPPHGLQHCS